jgi:hypothetical protein
MPLSMSNYCPELPEILGYTKIGVQGKTLQLILASISNKKMIYSIGWSLSYKHL